MTIRLMTNIAKKHLKTLKCTECGQEWLEKKSYKKYRVLCNFCTKNPSIRSGRERRNIAEFVKEYIENLDLKSFYSYGRTRHGIRFTVNKTINLKTFSVKKFKEIDTDRILLDFMLELQKDISHNVEQLKKEVEK